MAAGQAVQSEKLSPRGARQKEWLAAREVALTTLNCFQAISIMRTQIVPLGIQSLQRWRKRLWSIRVKKPVASLRRVNIS